VIIPLILFKVTKVMMSDEEYMTLALQEAQKAFEADEVPVGAVVTAHAEIMAITTAFQYLGSKYLPDATLYVTLEPCLMCSGALYWSKIGRVVFGASDEKNSYRKVAGANNPFHPKTIISGGILEEPCSQLMKTFFEKLRNK
jgi:tRNA(adenine34) deaminase